MISIDYFPMIYLFNMMISHSHRLPFKITRWTAFQIPAPGTEDMKFGDGATLQAWTMPCPE
jgi:hypothetical protein